ncbi:MAG: class 1 isoprenoid biosynthesis enzyme [Prolixibacteraceae bacterium]|jgi:hypothetical protein|nr:class 1 isoprenoid biosynthesis enzyme [Prolixibacteraceae bacterium]
MDIHKYISQFYSEWEKAGSTFFISMSMVNPTDKDRNETQVKKMVLSVEQKLKYKDTTFVNGKSIQPQKLSFLRDIFSFNDCELDLVQEIIDEDITRRFVQMALDFDPNVDMEDVFQAGRNLWIVNSLQILMGLPVELSKSVFAYCMLYPYTDDYLDNPDISKSEKVNFSKRFRLRLQGESSIALNELEEKIFDLVAFIEGDWPRNIYPGVYESLLAIHDAQTRSISLVHDEGEVNADELMSICIDKGGTSVLADGYLLKGTLTRDEEIFCFGFGTFLQFVDDIQDLKEDFNSNVQTVFTNAVQRNCIDAYINKTLSFGHSLMEQYLEIFPPGNIEGMRSLMLKSIHFLLIEAICLNAEFFPENYVLKYETYAPFSFDFIRERRNKMSKHRISSRAYLKKYFKNIQRVAI